MILCHWNISRPITYHINFYRSCENPGLILTLFPHNIQTSLFAWQGFSAMHISTLLHLEGPGQEPSYECCLEVPSWSTPPFSLQSSPQQLCCPAQCDWQVVGKTAQIPVVMTCFLLLSLCPIGPPSAAPGLSLPRLEHFALCVAATTCSAQAWI